MQVAIYSRGFDPEQKGAFISLISQLKQYGIKIYLFQSIATAFPEIVTDEIHIFTGYQDLPNEIKALISIGGDGTILDCVTIVREKDIPIMGINFGRLGFLASLSRDELSMAVDALFNDSFIVDKRSLVHVDGDVQLFDDIPFGLNDFAILKKDTSPMIKIHTFLNGEFLNTYWCDGLIVATPSGSTAYNLSCNGPVLYPNAQSFVITPIAPHQLNVRPIIVPCESIISFEVESRADQFICSLDARRAVVEKGIQLAVKKEAFEVGIIRLQENSFLTTMRNKLGWGLDKRN
ncbi:NAD kinase [Rhizosphaericola mali]|uniref:NAD kinase n=1 Tax=Rhizosphaericola mali TaxID=2545455 RepID=A0A5P2G9Y1_9BACT|nr:NAD kinase [Rhizosphaericola mali]QES90752.1 NAD kinase [Rhizosphaericola mali]